MSKKLMVRKANQLIEAKSKLSISEQRIILYLLSQIQPQDDDLKVYRLSLSEFAKLIGKTKSTIYEAAKEVTRDLIRRVMTLYESDGPLQIAWLSDAKYIPKEGVVELGFSPRLKPYLLGLKSCFTQYELTEVTQFSNQYSWRIYELCKQYLQIGERILFIDQLKQYLDLEQDKYSSYGHFKSRIIVPTAEEINEKTSLKIKFEEIKEARKIIAIKYTIKLIPKSNEKTQTPENEIQIAINEIAAASENNYLMEELIEYLGYEVSQELLFTYGVEHCQKQLNNLKEEIKYRDRHPNLKPIDNPGGWLKTAIEQDYKSKFEFKQKEKEKMEQMIFKLTEKIDDEKEQQIEENFDEVLKNASPEIQARMKKWGQRGKEMNN